MFTRFVLAVAFVGLLAIGTTIEFGALGAAVLTPAMVGAAIMLVAPASNTRRRPSPTLATMTALAAR